MYSIRQYLSLFEDEQHTYKMYHGSPSGNIDKFRLDNLRHRTGTPGTLSFTTSIDTARIYGNYVYTVNIKGKFGDYEVQEDVDKLFEARWSRENKPETEESKQQTLKWLARFQPEQSYEDYRQECKEKFYAKIKKGEYQMWENVFYWKLFDWQGAFTWESNSRNLIVGDAAIIDITDKKFFGETWS